MTELQTIQLDTLKEFIRICDELELTYFLVCGSALGAVKYQGFIPWDDDLDVALPREDYKIFCEKAPAMLPKHLFLQNYKTDPEFPLIFSKIRNSNTTFVEASLSRRNINHGVYIDVFPIDGYPDDKKSILFLEKEKRRYQLSLLSCVNRKRTWKISVLVFVERLICVDKFFHKFVERVERVLSQYPLETSQLWCNHGNWQGELEYAPREQYGSGLCACFEGMNVRIPERYDEYLTQKYGNWREEPPEEEQKGHHYHLICDCNRPYTDYIEFRNRKARIKKV